MGNWDNLSIKDRAELIRVYVNGGILDLDTIRNHYNSFSNEENKFVGGGDTDDDLIGPPTPASVLANNARIAANQPGFGGSLTRELIRTQKGFTSPSSFNAPVIYETERELEKPVNAKLAESVILNDTSRYVGKQLSRDEIMGVQQELVNAGYDLGRSGRGRDGIDGVWGSKTWSAYKDYFGKQQEKERVREEAAKIRERNSQINEEVGLMGARAGIAPAAAVTPLFGVSGLIKRNASEDSDVPELMSPLEGLSEEDIVNLYKGANKHAGRSSAYTLVNHLIPGTKKARMDRATKNQLAILLAKYGDRINTVDSFDELGEYGSLERTSKLSPIGYKHENELAGEKGKGVNESSTEGNALRTVLGMFGAVKDKDGNFLINDDYDNEVFRIEKDTLDANPELKKELQKMRVGKKKKKVLAETDKEKDTYLVTREGFDLLRENGLLDSPRTTLLKDLWKDIVKGETPYSEMETNDRLRRYGENAIVRTGKSTRFDFTMSNKEVNRRVRKARKKLGK